MTCEVCGRDMICTYMGTYHEPAEWDCPACDLGAEDADSWDEPDLYESGPDEDTTPARA